MVQAVDDDGLGDEFRVLQIYVDMSDLIVMKKTQKLGSCHALHFLPYLLRGPG